MTGAEAMAQALPPAEERRFWVLAGTGALLAHLGVAGLVLAGTIPPAPPIPEAVMLVELPPPAAAATARTAVAQPAIQPPTPQPQTAAATPRIPVDLPPVRTPLPANPVNLPPPVRDVEAAAFIPMAPAPAPAVRSQSSTNTGPGSDPRAQKQEGDYFALVSAHLNRRKTYPVVARQARQQGVVTIRFTIDRSGSISAVSIKRSSGHAVLDDATLALLQRVAPLPRIPAAIPRDSITLSLPIDYSLRTI